MVVYHGVAFTIGCSEYRHESKLKNALKDSRAMQRKLQACGYEVICMENPTKNEMFKGIESLKQKILKRNYREVIVYYAGHGIFNEHAHYMVLPEFNTKLITPNVEQLASHAFSVEVLIKIIYEAKPNTLDHRSIVVILDACRNLVSLEDKMESKLFADFIPPPQSIHEFFHDARLGILISYACECGGSAGEGKEDEHGVYTNQLLEQIFIPEFPIINALGRAHQLVVDGTSSEQKPHMEVNFPHYFMFSLNKGKLWKGNKSRSQSTEDFSQQKTSQEPECQCIFSFGSLFTLIKFK